MRLAICGGPRSGKTTLSERITGHVVRHTDDLMGLGWSEASDAAAPWFDEPGEWVIEGVATVRALRKWLEAHPEGKPCDRVVYLTKAHTKLSKGQASMAKGCKTVWLGSADRISVRDELARRGVEIQEGELPLTESGTFAVATAQEREGTGR